MQLWRVGDQVKVNNYLDMRGLQSNSLLGQIVQALIELAEVGSDERSILEAISNHVAARGDVRYLAPEAAAVRGRLMTAHAEHLSDYTTRLFA